jgi:hypothetical protein
MLAVGGPGRSDLDGVAVCEPTQGAGVEVECSGVSCTGGVGLIWAL